MIKDEPSGQDNREGRTETKAFLSQNQNMEGRTKTDAVLYQN